MCTRIQKSGGVPPASLALRNCELVDFKAASKDELYAFSLSRKSKSLAPPQDSGLVPTPNKGKGIEGEDKMLVNIAHSYRTQRVILTLPTQSPPPPPTQAPSLVNLNGAAAVADLQPSPSDMLSKVWWVELIRNCLKGTPAAAAAASVGDKPKKRADELFKKLSARQEASKLLLPEDM